jgi:Phosphotransferase enzyme family
LIFYNNFAATDLVQILRIVTYVVHVDMHLKHLLHLQPPISTDPASCRLDKTAASMLSQPGLRWELNKWYEAEPTWTHDPNVETIVKLSRHHLHFKADDICTADYFMQGALNRIYLIRCPRGGEAERCYIFRVSLPVDPGFKVSSDAATMSFMREHTDAPVPCVMAFDSSHENELGFAWTIMEMMPGRPLCFQWKYMTRQQKELLVKRVAEVVAQMFRRKFHGIGNLYQAQADESPPQEYCNNVKRIPKTGNSAPMSPRLKHHNDLKQIPRPENIAPADISHHSAGSTRSSPTNEVTKLLLTNGVTEAPTTNGMHVDRHDPKYSLGRIVSMSFLWHKRVHYDVYRGPFANSHDWMAARLAFVITESEAIISDPALDERQKSCARKFSSVGKRLEQQLANFFPVEDSCSSKFVPEVTTLHHFDMSGYNVLVDDEGRLTALLDWDGVSAVPLWKACQIPEFLMSRYIDEMGLDDGPGRVDGEYSASQILRDEAIDLEKEQLRMSFLTEMERLEPQWVEVYKASVRSADFDKAVQLCDSLSRTDLVAEWLHDIEQGREYWSLQQGLLEG